MTDDLLPILFGRELTRPVEFEDLVFLAGIHEREAADTEMNRRFADPGWSELSSAERRREVRRLVVRLAFQYWDGLGISRNSGGYRYPDWNLKDGTRGGPVVELVLEAFGMAGAVPPSRSTIGNDLKALRLR